jgi:hypothetical protein
MSLNLDPTDQLLDRHGKHWRTTFVPPPLEGMLAVATAQTQHRTRWLWPLAAAVALLVIPLLTVVGISGSHRSATHPAGFLGDLDWTGAVLQNDPRMLTIAVDINKTPNYCLDYGLPDVRAMASETATRVIIRAHALRPSHPSPTPSVPAGAGLACSGRGYSPVTVTVQLEQPLGTRSLIDAKTGIQRPVLEASTLLTPSWLPAGYVDLGFQWQDDNPKSQVLHRYGKGGAELWVVRGYEFPAPAPDERVLSTGTVLGHPAKVTAQAISPGVACMTWKDSKYSWLICSRGVAGAQHAPLSAGELLRIGNSMR